MSERYHSPVSAKTHPGEQRGDRRERPDTPQRPPPPGRLYWVCQIAGWGSFAIYVLASYLWAVGPHRRLTDVASILFFNVVVGPVVTHGLRRRMYARGWPQLPLRRWVPRALGSVVILAGGMTALVAIVAEGNAGLAAVQLTGIFLGFSWAIAGWQLIYYAVLARRRHDALRLQLAITGREAQLQSLRAQLNPHFLFNCLNSVRSLIIENPERASSMVTSLAEILRYSLASDRRDTVRFEEELDVIDEYVNLERMRFEERLRMERFVDPSVLDARIPPMLVQTLVENAVKHGISDLPQGGVVRLDARPHGARIEILVSNTGHLKAPAPDAGYGLRNATERLRLLYGDAASLTLREQDGTTVATLTIPVNLPT